MRDVAFDSGVRQSIICDIKELLWDLIIIPIIMRLNLIKSNIK